MQNVKERVSISLSGGREKEIRKYSKSGTYIKALVGIPTNMTEMTEVGGQSDLSLVQLALGPLLFFLAAKESTLSRSRGTTGRAIRRVFY